MTHDERLCALETELRKLRMANRVYAALLLVGFMFALVACSPQRELTLLGGASRNEVVLNSDGLVFKSPSGEVVAEFSPTAMLVGGGSSSSAKLDCGAAGANLTMFHKEQVRAALWTNKNEVQFSLHDADDDRRVSLVAGPKSTNFSLHQKEGESVLLLCEGGKAKIFPRSDAR